MDIWGMNRKLAVPQFYSFQTKIPQNTWENMAEIFSAPWWNKEAIDIFDSSWQLKSFACFTTTFCRLNNSFPPSFAVFQKPKWTGLYYRSSSTNYGTAAKISKRLFEYNDNSMIYLFGHSVEDCFTLIIEKGHLALKAILYRLSAWRYVVLISFERCHV